MTKAQDRTFLNAAMSYVKAGLYVIPLRDMGKIPRTAHGSKDASNDPAKVTEWWTKWPYANIGICTGATCGGLYVIDLDRHAEGFDGVKVFEEWERSHGAFQPSWTATTGTGGKHYYFRSNEPYDNKAGIVGGVDLRGNGGYVVAPASIHPDTGELYKWDDGRSIDDLPIAEIDDNIRYFIQQGGTNKPEPVHFVAPNKVPRGERNHAMFKCACMGQAKGLSDTAIFAMVSAENSSKCNPPLDDNEVLQIVNSVIGRYEKGKPIYIDGNMEATQGRREPVFDLNSEGHIKKTIHNMTEAIEYTDGLYGHIAFNELARSIYVIGSLPWNKKNEVRQWIAVDDDCLLSFMEKRFGFSNKDKVMSALSIVANNHAYNPIKDMLVQIEADYPDHSGAIRTLLPKYLGCEDTDYNYEVIKVHMLGALSRLYHPGTKYDYCPIIYGEQGVGKSEFIRHLAIDSDWLNDNFGTFDGDKAVEKLLGVWMIELAELKALKSARDSETVKSFLTSREDRYRFPYSRRVESMPRMCVFAGTTNNMNVFADKTGNRRFLPIITNKEAIRVHVFDKNQQAVNGDFMRAWAEALELFHASGDKPDLVIPRHLESTAKDMQYKFTEEDEKIGIIQGWLDEHDITKTCVPIIIEKCLGIEVAKATKQLKREVIDIMDNQIPGFSRLDTHKGRARFGQYGTQIAFLRDYNPEKDA